MFTWQISIYREMKSYYLHIIPVGISCNRHFSLDIFRDVVCSLGMFRAASIPSSCECSSKGVIVELRNPYSVELLLLAKTFMSLHGFFKTGDVLNIYFIKAYLASMIFRPGLKGLKTEKKPICPCKVSSPRGKRQLA
jgi:hypothetical protein